MKKLNRYRLNDILLSSEFSFVVFDDEMSAYDLTEDWEDLACDESLSVQEVSGVDDIKALVFVYPESNSIGPIAVDCVCSRDDLQEWHLESGYNRKAVVLAAYTSDGEEIAEFLEEVSHNGYMV